MKKYIDYEFVIQALYVASVIAVGIFTVLHMREDPQNIFAVFTFLAITVVAGVVVYKATLSSKNFGRINCFLNEKFGTLVQKEEILDAVVYERWVHNKKCGLSLSLEDGTDVYWPCWAEVDPHLWKNINAYDKVEVKCSVTRHLYGGHYRMEKAKVISLSFKK